MKPLSVDDIVNDDGTNNTYTLYSYGDYRGLIDQVDQYPHFPLVGVRCKRGPSGVADCRYGARGNLRESIWAGVSNPSC